MCLHVVQFTVNALQGLQGREIGGKAMPVRQCPANETWNSMGHFLFWFSILELLMYACHAKTDGEGYTIWCSRYTENVFTCLTTELCKNGNLPHPPPLPPVGNRAGWLPDQCQNKS